jgi:membrane fusion protein (multidrug efflux system)
VTAVQNDQNSQFVLIVGPDHKVAQKTVMLGEQLAQNFIVKSGVKLGDQVIVDGIQKVKVGQTVTSTVAPASSGQ